MMRLVPETSLIYWENNLLINQWWEELLVNFSGTKNWNFWVVTLYLQLSTFTHNSPPPCVYVCVRACVCVRVFVCVCSAGALVWKSSAGKERLRHQEDEGGRSVSVPSRGWVTHTRVSVQFLWSPAGVSITACFQCLLLNWIVFVWNNNLHEGWIYYRAVVLFICVFIYLLFYLTGTVHINRTSLEAVISITHILTWAQTWPVFRNTNSKLTQLKCFIIILTRESES